MTLHAQLSSLVCLMYTGIHDSGAQFDRMDAPPIIIRVDNTKWIQYTE